MARPDDALLRAAHLLLTLIIAILVLGLVAIVIGGPIVFVLQDRFIARFTAEYGAIASPRLLIWALEAILALAFVMILAVLAGTRQLRSIVDSVAEGDPFIPENARRLRLMGWLSAAAQIVTLPAVPLSKWVEGQLKGAHLGFTLSIAGVLLTLLLFILARVFERGTAMRADLEGTV